MNPRPKPIHRLGDRNIFCPYYRNCLDYAVKCSWTSWDCSQCPYRFIKQSFNGNGYGSGDPEIYGDLPLPVLRRIRDDPVDLE